MDGGDFFSRWDFWTEKDPTKGFVDYVSKDVADSEGLTSLSARGVYMGVDMVSQSGAEGRRSVRLHSRETYNSGLFIIRIEHAPAGCGLWPAFWMYGEDATHPWPTWGEYDIIESIHTAGQVMTTLHTSGAECSQSGLVGGQDFIGSWVMTGEENSRPADNCDIHAPHQAENQGCSQLGPDASIGPAFNEGGGGTFAADWDPDAGHIRTWFFRPGAEPSDLAEGAPNPDAWDVPYSYFSLSPDKCGPGHFANMRLIFDTTFCGDLGAPFFSAMCPEEAKTATCEQFVAQHPERMSEAYWLISSLDVYHKESEMPAPPPPPPPLVVPEAPTQRSTVPPPPVAPIAVPTSSPEPQVPIPWDSGPIPPPPVPSPPMQPTKGTHSDEGIDHQGGQGWTSPLLYCMCGFALIGAVVAAAVLYKMHVEQSPKVAVAEQKKRGLAMYEDVPSHPEEDFWSSPFQAEFEHSAFGDELDTWSATSQTKRDFSVPMQQKQCKAPLMLLEEETSEDDTP